MMECSVCVIQGVPGVYLISQRKPNDRFGGYWEFPGGKRQEGETLEECAIREVREEVNLEIELERRVLTVAHNHHRGKTDPRKRYPP